MVKINCEICNKKIDITQWCGTVDIAIWGMVKGEKNDYVRREELDVCNNCQKNVQILIYKLKEDKNLITRLKQLKK